MVVRNWVLLLLTLAAITSLATMGFLTHAPNRIVPGSSISIFGAVNAPACAALIVLGIALLLFSFLPQNAVVSAVVGLLLTAALIALLLAAGVGAGSLAAANPPGARTSLGVAFWLSISAVALALVDLAQQARLAGGGKAALVLGGAAIVIALAAIGLFDNLSIAREYRAHADTFNTELWRHVILVMVSVSLALLIGLPLGATAFRSPRFGRRLFAVLGIVQTIPAIALFGLLIGPLSALGDALPWLRNIGIAGIGTTPAIIALVLYGLLPLVRNTVAGLEGVPEQTIDAARGSGMRSRQILFKVTLPLAFPVILSGLRVVLIQTIGLAVVAALIGAGGLGAFVFLGLGRNAIDLVMLGVIPTIVLALVAEVLVSIIIAGASRAP